MLKHEPPRVLDQFPLDPSLQTEIDKFKALAMQAKSILISSTLTSDGDSIRAQIGIYELLTTMRGSSQNLAIVDQSPVPLRYRFLKGSELIQSWAEWKKSSATKSFDLGIVCDGGIERTGEVAPAFEGIAKNVLVDHHAVGSKRDYDSKILDMKSSSTAELVYLLFEYFGVKVSKELAEALYIGIVFDTGFFKHSLTTPRTHLVAARLISTGIDFSKISDRAILERSWPAQLLLKSMMDNLERFENGRAVVSHWSLKDLERINPQDGDQEGMINQLYYTEGASVVALLTEMESNQTKISFRSKNEVNVAEIARSLHPDGGGHIRAAGCLLNVNLDAARKLVRERLKEILV